MRIVDNRKLSARLDPRSDERAFHVNFNAQSDTGKSDVKRAIGGADAEIHSIDRQRTSRYNQIARPQSAHTARSGRNTVLADELDVQITVEENRSLGIIILVLLVVDYRIVKHERLRVRVVRYRAVSKDVCSVRARHVNASY